MRVCNLLPSQCLHASHAIYSWNQVYILNDMYKDIDQPLELLGETLNGDSTRTSGLYHQQRGQ